MIYGNHGKILDVNLDDGTIGYITPPEYYYKDYIGGKGLAARLLWDILPKHGKTDPFGSENPLIFMLGPITGNQSMGSSRCVVVTKSPLSKFVTESYGGGYFPNELKHTGIDGIIFRGKSDKPVYLELVDGNTKLKDATDIWGKGVFDTHFYFEEKYGKIRSAIIGPAGENLVRYSAIIFDMDRAAARGGPGAVMGNKKLKGIVVRGKIKSNIFDNDIFTETNKSHRSRLIDDMNMRDGFGKYGTSSGPTPLSKMNILPTKNFKYGTFEHADLISGEYMEKIGLLVGRNTCATCATACKRRIKGNYMGTELTEYGSSLEYETLAGFGSMMLNKNIKLNALANQLCNDYGLDTISTSGSIAFVMEATERGLNNKLGVSINWGDEEMIIDAIHKIAHRDGYGNILAEGTMRMAKIIGGDEFAMHVKGLEVAYHEARGKIGLGLSYATSPRGATHMEGFHDTMVMRENANPSLGAIEAMKPYDPKNKATLVVNFENVRSFTNSLIFCAFDIAMTGKYNNLDLIMKITESATGYSMNIEDMKITGERIYNMMRMIAVREGLNRTDDNLPPRFKNEPLIYDGIESKIDDDILNNMLEEYYKARGWDINGAPTKETISRLNLPDFP